jgi:tetratricopeptide (TPR) repeat protein
MGMILASQGKTTEAIETFQKAIEADEKAEIKGEVAGIHYNLGVLLKKVGKTQEAKEQLDKAAELYRKDLPKYANSAEVHVRLGDTLAENANFSEASEAFAKAISLNPGAVGIHMKLIQSLEYQGRLNEAISASKQAYEVMNKYKQTEIAEQFKKYTEYLKKKL